MEGYGNHGALGLVDRWAFGGLENFRGGAIGTLNRQLVCKQGSHQHASPKIIFPMGSW